MGQMLLVTLREGIEMFLIVAIAATYLRKSGRAALFSAVGWGTATAIAASVVLGTWLAEVAVLPKWEALLALVAAVLVISMVIYMLKAARHMRRDIGARLEAATVRTGRAAWLGVFLFVVLMVTRAGRLRRARPGGRLGVGLGTLWPARQPRGVLLSNVCLPRVVRASTRHLLFPRGDRGEPPAARQRVLACGH
jgi:high-affinity iron transporter